MTDPALQQRIQIARSNAIAREWEALDCDIADICEVLKLSENDESGELR